MTPIQRLEAALRVILDEAKENPEFLARLDSALAGTSQPGRRRNRRESSPLDPFKLFESDGESGLRAALGVLDIERLKDVVSEYDMDRSKLALKWRSAERLVDRIVETVIARNRKGDVFLAE